jgi:putative PIN family toxin of toxin-antitoxin system
MHLASKIIKKQRNIHSPPFFTSLCMPTSSVIVIDTNVCLDLFVFHDPRWQDLLIALRDKQVKAITSTPCRTEWQIVLTYPHLPLNDETRAQSAAEFDALIALVPDTAPNEQAAEQVVRLPVCIDPDDQKFLELARDTQATTLITKDKALLKLARKTVKLGLFSIVSPETWVRDYANAKLQLK